MKMLVLYRPHSEHARAAEAFVHDFKSEHEDVADRMEVQDFDSRDGNATASLYDIFQSPAILLISYDGSLVKYWAGDPLPLINEVASYVYSGV